MNKFLLAVLVLIALVFCASAAVHGFEDDMLFDGGANPSLCTCACECARPKVSDLLKEKSGYGTEMVGNAVPVKINNVA